MRAVKIAHAFLPPPRVRVDPSPQVQIPQNRQWVKEKILMILNGQWRKKENLNERN